MVTTGEKSGDAVVGRADKRRERERERERERYRVERRDRERKLIRWETSEAPGNDQGRMRMGNEERAERASQPARKKP